MTAIFVIKVLLVGGLIGGFFMFSLFRQKQAVAGDKKVGIISVLIGFVLRLILIAGVAIVGFWFVTKFLA